MDWKLFFRVDKNHLKFRIVIIGILLVVFYLVSLSMTPITSQPVSKVWHIIPALEMLLYFYIPIELAIFLIRLYLFIDFKSKKYIVIAYLLLFIAVQILGDFDNGRYDRYLSIGGYLFLVSLLALIASYMNTKKNKP